MGSRGTLHPLVFSDAVIGIFQVTRRLWMRSCGYVEQFVVPILRQGDIVIMDDLPSHKVAGIREAIEAAGAELRYLPPYSPDFSPIEQFFAKLKALLRKAAARTIDSLIAAIADALTKVSAHECANYLANQGYRRQL
jgi:transposase